MADEAHSMLTECSTDGALYVMEQYRQSTLWTGHVLTKHSTDAALLPTEHSTDGVLY